MMDIQEFSKILESECALNGERPVIVAVSGGPDSLTLLHLLSQTSFALIVAHFDHGLRSESKDEGDIVRRFAESANLPFRSELGDVRAYAEKNRLSIEEAAREQRYSFLFSLAEEMDAQALAVGHTADDQVETLLMHLLRGTGLAGLRGMAYLSMPSQWSLSIPLIRPLLDFNRDEILAYCQEMKLEPISDSSNLDQSFTRNRIRHDLLPTLQKYNPQVKELLLQSAELLSEDYKLIESLSDMAWEKCLHQIDQGRVALDRQMFLKQPLGVQRMLLRQVFKSLRPEARNLDYAAIERALKIIENTSTSKQDWLANLSVIVEEDLIWVADWGADLPAAGPQLTQDGNRALRIPGVVELNEGWQIRAEEILLASSSKEAQRRNPNEAWLDRDRITEGLKLRTRKPGDRFRPLGMEKGSMKLSDFMINVKIPRRARDAWPLLSHRDEIIWVPGYRQSQSFCLRATSRKAVHLSMRQQSA